MMIRQFSRSGGTFLIIEETCEGFFLYSFPKFGIEGDTWHESLEGAKEQALHQFGAPTAVWFLIPTEVTDLQAFGRENSK